MEGHCLFVLCINLFPRLPSHSSINERLPLHRVALLYCGEPPFISQISTTLNCQFTAQWAEYRHTEDLFSIISSFIKAIPSRATQESHSPLRFFRGQDHEAPILACVSQGSLITVWGETLVVLTTHIHQDLLLDAIVKSGNRVLCVNRESANECLS